MMKGPVNKIRIKVMLALWGLIFLTPLGVAAESSNMILILDASGSMWGQIDGKAKITIAKEVLAELIKGLPDDLHVGLTAYGHRRKGDCDDVEELVPLQPMDKQNLLDTIKAISPKGMTPITLSVQQTAEKVKTLEGETTIILISDGKETCAGDPCALVQTLKEAGVRFSLYVIGFDVTEEERQQLDCMAQAGGGRYYSAKSAQEFKVAAQQAIQESQNFGVLEVAATKSGKLFGALVEVYTADDRRTVAAGYGDDKKPYSEKIPPGTYDIVVRDLSVPEKPFLELKGIEIEVGQTNHQAAEFVQEGMLAIAATKAGRPFVAFFRMHKAGERSYFHSGYTKAGQALTHKVLPGRYDVFFQDGSVLQKPELWVRDVVVEAGKTGEAVIDFSQSGDLDLEATKAGRPFVAFFRMHKAGESSYFLSGYTKAGQALTHKVVPGRYDVFFQDRSVLQKPELWVRDVVVEADKTGEAVIDFSQSGTLELTASQGGAPVAALYTVIQAEGERMLLQGYTETKKAITLNVVPGRYKVLFDYSKPAKVRKEVELEVQSGQSARASAEF